MSKTDTQTPNANFCEQCKATGLPIMPVRYAVAPVAVKPALPGWVSGDKVKSVALGDKFHYVLRTLRTGYVYLYYDKNARGKQQWECYSVGQDGSLLRVQGPPETAKPQSQPVVACQRHGSNNTQVHYIVIEQPEKCGPTWIAFTAEKWSQQTLDEYKNNSKLRNKRMQTIHPAAMAGGAKHSHGAIATRQVLESVLEYADTAPDGVLPFGNRLSNISKEDGSCDASAVARMGTRYPWHMRKNMAESTAEHMVQRGQGTAGKASQPHVLALWDAVGITHELSGFCNDAMGWAQKYGDERLMQIDAIMLYNGLQQGLEHRAVEKVRNFYATGQSTPTNEMNRLRYPIMSNTHDADAARSFSQKYYLISQSYRNGEISLEELQAQRAPLVQQYAKNPAALEEALKREDDIKRSTARGIENAVAKEQARVQENSPWSKYAERIDQSVLQTFKDKQKAFEQTVSRLVEQRSQPLIHWLEAPLLLDTLNDFHGQSIEDGVLFEDCIGEAFVGLGGSNAGRQKIRAWAQECKASVESNLLWRAVALNQDGAREELDQALVDAMQHHGAQTPSSAVDWGTYLQKGLKTFADVYKRAQGIFNANQRAMSEAGSSAFGARIKPVNMRGIDRIVIAAGDSVFKQFRIDKLADYASEKIIQHIFSVRALVDPKDSLNLVKVQAANEQLSREQTLRRLRAAHAFLAADTPAIRSAQTDALRAGWASFRSSGSAASAIKDARLALVVALIEGVNFAKLIADCNAKGDARSRWSLLASGMSITSALFDISATVVRNLPGMSDAAWGYQKLKLLGGLLSGAASFIGGVLDFFSAKEKRSDGYLPLAVLYGMKSFLLSSSGSLVLTITFTYSAPLIARITGSAAAGTVVRNVGARAAAVIGLRIFGMALGGWITVGTFGIQVIIWCVTPNALEKWVDHSAFGNKRNNNGARTAEEQQKKLEEALVEMGIK